MVYVPSSSVVNKVSRIFLLFLFLYKVFFWESVNVSDVSRCIGNQTCCISLKTLQIVITTLFNFSLIWSKL